MLEGWLLAQTANSGPIKEASEALLENVCDSRTEEEPDAAARMSLPANFLPKLSAMHASSRRSLDETERGQCMSCGYNEPLGRMRYCKSCKPEVNTIQHFADLNQRH